jgi:hypothetical protein
METQLAHARIDEDGSPVLVLFEYPCNPQNVAIFIDPGQVQETSRAYLDHHTAPADVRSPGIVALALAYADHAGCRVAFINHY